MKKALTILILFLFLSITGFAANLAAVITALGARESTLTIYKQYAVTDNLTVPANITLKFLQGGSLTITAAKTVTINGRVEAGLFQVFEGAGAVSFGVGSLKEAYSEWWGIDGVADEVQINKAINSFATSGNVKLLATTYLIAAAIVPTTKVNLIGAGIDNTIIEQTEEIDLINIGISVLAEYITIRGIKLVGKNGTAVGIEIGDNAENIIVEDVYCTTAEFGFVTFGTNVTFKNCEAYNNGNDTTTDGDGFVADDASKNTFFINCEASYHSRTVSNGFECEDAALNIVFRDCVSHHNKKNGFSPHTHNGNCENVLIDGCFAYDNELNGVDNSGTDYVVITNSFFYDNGTRGIYCSASAIIKNCYIYDNGDSDTGWGIEFSGASSKFILEGCEIHHIAYLGVDSGAITAATGVSFLSIKNCIITGSYGINLFQQAGDIIIEGCRLIGDTTYGDGNGIYINNATAGTKKSLLITNNVITDFGVTAIRLFAGRNVIISGNRIYDNTAFSINATGGTAENVIIIQNIMQADSGLADITNLEYAHNMEVN